MAFTDAFGGNLMIGAALWRPSRPRAQPGSRAV